MTPTARKLGWVHQRDGQRINKWAKLRAVRVSGKWGHIISFAGRELLVSQPRGSSFTDLALYLHIEMVA